MFGRRKYRGRGISYRYNNRDDWWVSMKCTLHNVPPSNRRWAPTPNGHLHFEKFSAIRTVSGCQNKSTADIIDPPQKCFLPPVSRSDTWYGNWSRLASWPQMMRTLSTGNMPSTAKVEQKTAKWNWIFCDDDDQIQFYIHFINKASIRWARALAYFERMIDIDICFLCVGKFLLPKMAISMCFTFLFAFVS